MQFPTLTKKQSITNKMAQQNLIKGKYYRFEPPVIATAIPTGGSGVCRVEQCTFNRGWYIGCIDRSHVFSGKPVNDQRIILIPQGYEDVPNLSEIMEQLHNSYFHVLFIGGSIAVLDTDQNH